jgi:hypothetical protein
MGTYETIMKRLQKEEIDLEKRKRDLINHYNMIEQDYYKELCGNKYNEINKCFSKLQEYVVDMEGAYETKNNFEQFVCKSLNKLISKKTELPINAVYDAYYTEKIKTNLYVGLNGFSKKKRWSNIAEKITNIQTITDIFNSCNENNIKVSDFLFKENKKQIVDVYQKYLPKLVLDLNFKSEIKMESDTIILRKKEKKITDFEPYKPQSLTIEFSDYTKSIHFDKYYSYMKLFHGSPNNKQYFNNYDCYLLSQVWNDEIKKQINNAINKFYNIQVNNKKIIKKIYDDISHLVVIDEL